MRDERLRRAAAIAAQGTSDVMESWAEISCEMDFSGRVRISQIRASGAGRDYIGECYAFDRLSAGL